jgi:hypothetical protein
MDMPGWFVGRCFSYDFFPHSTPPPRALVQESVAPSRFMGSWGDWKVKGSGVSDDSRKFLSADI